MSWPGYCSSLAFEPLEQGEGVGRRAGEAADHLALGEAADLRALPFTIGLPEAHLAVAADHDAAALADHEDRRGVHAGGGVFGHGQKDSGRREGSGALRAVCKA